MPDLTVHYTSVIEERLRVGSKAQRVLNTSRRADTPRNHSATSLQQHALKKIPGEQVQPKRRLTEPEYLSLDFNPLLVLSGGEVGETGLPAMIQETRIAAEIQRLEVLTEREAKEHLTGRIRTVEALAAKRQTNLDALEIYAEQAARGLAALPRRLARTERAAVRQAVDRLASGPKTASAIQPGAMQVSASDDKTLHEQGDQIRSRLDSGAVKLETA